MVFLKRSTFKKVDGKFRSCKFRSVDGRWRPVTLEEFGPVDRPIVRVVDAAGMVDAMLREGRIETETVEIVFERARIDSENNVFLYGIERNMLDMIESRAKEGGSKSKEFSDKERVKVGVKQWFRSIKPRIRKSNID